MPPNKSDWIDETVAALPPLCTTEETAAVLRFTKRTLAKKIADGTIASVRHGEAGGARRLIPRAAIGKYLRSLEA